MKWGRKAEQEKFAAKERQKELNQAQFAGEPVKPSRRLSEWPPDKQIMPPMHSHGLDQNFQLSPPSSFAYRNYIEMMAEERLHLDMARRMYKVVTKEGPWGPVVAYELDPEEAERLELIAELKRIQAEEDDEP